MAKIVQKTIKGIDVQTSWNLIKDKSTREIAELTNLSESTIRRHKTGKSKRFTKLLQKRLIRSDFQLEYKVAEVVASISYRQDRYDEWKTTNISSNLHDNKKDIMNEFKRMLYIFINKYGQENVKIEEVNLIEHSRL